MTSGRRVGRTRRRARCRSRCSRAGFWRSTGRTRRTRSRAGPSSGPSETTSTGGWPRSARKATRSTSSATASSRSTTACPSTVSTPTLKGGRIDTLFQRSDQRRYFLQCPACGRWDYVTWSDAKHVRVTFDDHDPETARLSVRIPNTAGAGSTCTNRSGWRWWSTASGARRSPRSQAGWLPPVSDAQHHRFAHAAGARREVVVGHLEGEGGDAGVHQHATGGGWEDRGARMDSHTLLNRREDYGEGVDVTVRRRRADGFSIDVQDNRLEMHVWGWGSAMERWLVDVHIIPGNLKHASTWTAVLGALHRRYTHATQHQLPILSTCIDSGFGRRGLRLRPAHQARRVFATKGFAGRSGNPIVGKPSEQLREETATGAPVYPINVDDAKTDLYSALALTGAGPGRLHFPSHLEAVDEELRNSLRGAQGDPLQQLEGGHPHRLGAGPRTQRGPRRRGPRPGGVQSCSTPTLRRCGRCCSRRRRPRSRRSRSSPPPVWCARLPLGATRCRTSPECRPPSPEAARSRPASWSACGCQRQSTTPTASARSGQRVPVRTILETDGHRGRASG